MNQEIKIETKSTLKHAATFQLDRFYCKTHDILFDGHFYIQAMELISARFHNFIINSAVYRTTYISAYNQDIKYYLYYDYKNDVYTPLYIDDNDTNKPFFLYQSKDLKCDYY